MIRQTNRFLFKLLLTILCTSSLAALSRAQNPDSGAVDEVIRLYDEGKFRDAEVTALRALQSPQKPARVDQAILHKYLAFSYVAMGDAEKARNEFLNLLELDPLARLDSLYISPKIIAVFREAQQGYRSQRQQSRPPDLTHLNLQIAAVKRSLLFPGLGQLYRKQQVKGYSLLASEVVFLGSFIFCQVQYDQARDRYLAETNPSKMQRLYDDVNLYYRGRYASAILAAGVYLYSLFDVLYFPPPSESKPSRLSLAPSLRTGPSITLTLTFSMSPRPAYYAHKPQ